MFRIEWFGGGGGYEAGFYVIRKNDGGHSEYLSDKFGPLWFGSVEEAEQAIDRWPG